MILSHVILTQLLSVALVLILLPARDLAGQAIPADKIYLPVSRVVTDSSGSELRYDIYLDVAVSGRAPESVAIWNPGGEEIPVSIRQARIAGEGTSILTVTIPEGFDPSSAELLIVREMTDTSGWSPIRRAAATGIYLGTDVASFVTGADVVDGLSGESSLVARMLEEIRETGAFLAEDPDPDPALAAPIAYGNFRGVPLADAMTAADSSSLISCIEYLMADPGEFRGKRVSVVRAYAWWAAYGGPTSPVQIRNMLMAADRSQRQTQILEQFGPEIMEYGWVDHWTTEAERAGMEGDFAFGTGILSVSFVAAEYFHSTIDLAWAEFVRGRLAEMSDSLEPALIAYRRAIELFDESDGRSGLAASLHNVGSIARRLGRYDEAVNSLDRAVEVRRSMSAVEGQEGDPGRLAGSLELRAGIRGDLVDLEGAESDYLAAADLHLQTGNRESAAWDYYLLASLLNANAEVSTAESWLDSARVLFRSVGNVEGEADVLDEIAYGLSNVGRPEEAKERYEEAHRLHLKSGELDDAGFSMANVGQMYWTLGDLFNAERAHLDAITLRQDAGNPRGEAYSWKKLAIMYYENGEPVKANAALERAGELYATSGTDEDRTELAVTRGDFLAAFGTFQSARDAYTEALDYYRSQGDPHAVAGALVTIGDLLLDNGEFRVAHGYYDEARKILFDEGDRLAAYRATSGLGLVAWNERRYEEAAGWLNEAREMAVENGNREDIAWTLRNIGQIEMSRGRTSDAYRAFLEVRDVYDSTSNYDGQIDVRLNLGYLYEEGGRFEEAMEEFTRAREIAITQNRRRRIGDILTATAGLHLLLGRFEQALSADSSSLALARESQNAWGVANVHVGLGNTWNTMGEFQRAYENYSIADSIFLSLGDTAARGTPLNNMGTIWYFQGDYHRALEHFNVALSILRGQRLYNEFLAIVVSNIGEVYYEQGRLNDAEEWLREAIEIADSVGARRILSSTLTILTKTVRDLGRTDEGLEIGTRALSLSDDIGELEQRAEIRGVLGDLYVSMGDRDRGEGLLRESVALARTAGSRRYLWQPLLSLAELEIERGEPGRAVDYLKGSVDAIEFMRNRVAGGEESAKIFSANRARLGVYELLVGLLIESGEVETALGYLERSSNEDLRSRLSPSLSGADGDRESAVQTGRRMKAKVDLLAERIAREQNEEDGDAGKIAGLREVYSVAESEYIGFVSRTIEDEPGLRNFFSNGVNPIELRSRKKRIPGDVAVLSYLLGESSLFVFVATGDTVVARVVPVGRREIASEVSLLRSVVSLSPDSPGRIDAKARISNASDRLWRWLIEPIEDRIAGRDRLAIIPSGELGYLPFEILGETGSSPLSSSHSIFYISDLGIFLHDNPRDFTERIAAFANPDGTLPHSKEEAFDIVELYPGSLLYEGKDATENRVKEVPEGISTLHFATHGTLDYRDVENSWLTLAPGDGEDGKLTLSEIWGITNLSDCRLVTLSACNTAIGEDLVEGWPINPANAFLQVGVPSVVATLWRVDDEATARFMVEFYRHLPEEGAADALVSARRTLSSSERFSDPYYWAPFILLGDWR